MPDLILPDELPGLSLYDLSLCKTNDVLDQRQVGLGMQPRLTADFWVRAYLERLRLAAIPAFVTAHGDATAGDILVKLATLDGNAWLFQRSYDFEQDARSWVSQAKGAETEIDALVARQRARDPDLWVIEVEDRDGRHLLDDPGLNM